MGNTTGVKNSKALSRHRHRVEFKAKLLRLHSLLEVKDDRVYTVVLIKLMKLLKPIIGTSSKSYFQVYEYEEVKFKTKVALQKAISQMYYLPTKGDSTDYTELATQSLNEFRAYINNAHKYYGVLTKI